MRTPGTASDYIQIIPRSYVSGLDDWTRTAQHQVCLSERAKYPLSF